MAQAKGQRDGMVLSSENRRRPMSSGEVEGVSWQGLRTIFLKKNSQGFGFTLRHFIVYPPESSLHSLKDEENGNALGKGSQQSCLEPMDTIFVKSVKEHGPAQQAGLCSGDRLVKVNGKIILGKTYSQVIALIQNSENILELTIMPKDEDVLQLVYSQDAYLKGNEPYLGEAQNLPDPPSLCYHSTKPSSTARLASQSIQSPLDTGQCRPDPSLVDDRLPAASNPTSEDSNGHFAPAGWHRGRSCSAINALDFHFSNHNAAIVCATLPPPRKSRLPASVHSHTDALCQQALSHWYYSQTEAAERMPSRDLSTSQDHLVELGLGLAPKPTFSMSTASAEQHRKEILLNQQATASNDCYWMGVLSGISGTGRRSCSESLLAAYAEYEHNYGRSVEMLAQASALVSPRYEQTSQSPQVTKMSKQKDQKSSGGQQHKSITSPITTSSSQSTIMDTTNSISGQQVAEPQTRRIKEDEPVGYKSYSPSFSHKAIHLVHQAHSIREPSYSGPNPSSWSSTTDIEGGVVPRLQSTLAFSGLEEERSQLDESREVISPNQEVVLRQQPPSNRRKPTQALQHPNYTTPVESTEPSVLTPSPGNASLVSSRTGPNSRTNGSLAEHAYDSLSSIPFIGSIKSRRSSYLLAITTERSKSCDEGLNTFKEENRVFSKLPKRVKSFFTDGSLESLRAQEEARSKRHSTSELGSITFSDVRKEGWLHYKQILTEKGKKVGGGMRPWKRVFSVLRCHSLFLYKDKREAVLHGAGAGASQDEHPPVSIRGCLIDIAYSETKRKHTLRLTTQDFCEYLLQAEDRDDMLAWIRAIRENSKTDNEEISFSKQALINKKLNDYRKHSLTGNKTDSSPRTHRMMPTFLLSKTDSTSLNRTDENKALWGINIMKKTRKPETPKAFGVRLEDCQPAVNHKFVPLIVEMCCGVVETTGLEYTGIYRVPGNNAMVSNLQEHLNKGMDIHTAEERWQDLNVICSLLKSFFRKLPEPLFTDDKYNDFIDANRIEDAEDRLKTMKKLIQDLPDHYYHTLKFLVAHLKKVADHSVKNKMEPRNLALVFGPTLVRTSADNMTDMVTHMPDRYKIVETLILHCDWFFSDGELDEEEKAPEDKQNMQPAPNIDHLLSNIGRPGMPDSTTSNSLKSKNSLGSKKDHNTKDFLPTSMISTVTRKRKKCLSTHLPGSSTDEESDREPVEASIYREGEGGENDRGQEEEAEGEHTISKKDKKGNGVKARETTEVTDSQVGGEKAEKEGRGGISNGIIKFPRESRQRITSPGNVSQLHPNSFFYSHHQSHATNIRLPPTTNSTSTLGPQKLARGHPMVPLWVSPTRLHSHYQSSSFYQTKQLDWNQPVPVIYRKTRGGRIRAISMNPELELGWNEDIVKRWSAQKVEVVKVIEERPGQIGSVGVLQGSVVDSRSIQQIDSLPCLAQDAPTLASSTSGWKRQCST